MPLATRPNATYEITLSTDRDLPENKRPIFIFRFVSSLEWEELIKYDEKFGQSNDPKEMLNLAFEVINKTLVGWRNMVLPSGEKVSFDLKRLRSLVSVSEATELMQAGIAQSPSLEDKKKSVSPSASSTEKSAKTAKERKTARTSPRRQLPSK